MFLGLCGGKSAGVPTFGAMATSSRQPRGAWLTLSPLLIHTTDKSSCISYTKNADLHVYTRQQDGTAPNGVKMFQEFVLIQNMAAGVINNT